MIKKLIVTVIGACLAFTTYAFADTTVKISLNGMMIQNEEYSPFVDENDRTMISIRWVSDELNYNVDWNADAQTATVNVGANFIKLQVNSTQILKNNTTIEMDTIPVLKNDRLFIPLRYLSQCFGFDVEWNKMTNTVYVIQPERILFKDEDYGVLIPKGSDKSEYKTVKNKFDNYSVVAFQDPESGGLLFSLSYFDLNYWEKEVQEDFPVQYDVLYKDDQDILICISVSDIQYDPENAKQKEHYLKLLNTKKQICDSLFVFSN